MSIDSGKPSNHYQLLRLQPFESDQAVIRSHFQKLVDQLKVKLKSEPHVIKWKGMQQEFVKAMLVLGDARRKNEYDASLGNKSGRDVRPPDLATILRRRKLVDDVALDRAVKFADTVNIDLRDAVVQQKLASVDVIMPLYADSLGLPFVRLDDLVIDESLIATVPAVMARQQSLVPVLREGRYVIVASPNPLRSEIEEQLQLRFESSIRQVICTKAAVDQAIAEHYPREAAQAQIAASPQNAATKRAGKSSAAEPEQRLTPAERRAQKLKIGFVCGAFTAMVVIFAGTMFTDYEPTMLQLAGLVVGGLAFGIGYLAGG